VAWSSRSAGGIRPLGAGREAVILQRSAMRARTDPGDFLERQDNLLTGTVKRIERGA
jgi:hypothetical protein